MSRRGKRNHSTVRIVAVSFLIDETTHAVQDNLERCAAYTAEAAARKADVLCFPEYVPTAGIDGDAITEAKRMTRQCLEHFSLLARQYGVRIIAPFPVYSGGRVYSQASVFDAQGKIVGKYRKIQLNGAELKNMTAGDALPVFNLDIGPVAVMLCFEIHFPEIARIYAMKGAKILFWPTMTHGPTQESLLIQARARAVDNSICLVEANYAAAPPYAPYSGRFLPGNARIIDHNGDLLAQSGRRHGLAVADVDVSETRLASKCVLLREPDCMREDIEGLMRFDVYAREYGSMLKGAYAGKGGKKRTPRIE